MNPETHATNASAFNFTKHLGQAIADGRSLTTVKGSRFPDSGRQQILLQITWQLPTVQTDFLCNPLAIKGVPTPPPSWYLQSIIRQIILQRSRRVQPPGMRKQDRQTELGQSRNTFNRLADILYPVRVLVLIFLYWLSLLCAFQVGFLAYNLAGLEQQGVGWLWQAFWHGIQMRASIAAYLSLAAGLLLTLQALWQKAQPWQTVLGWYITTATVLVSLIEAADWEMFRAWGSHFHALALAYLAHPAEAAASISGSPWYVCVLGAVVAGVVWLNLFNRMQKWGWLSPRLEAKQTKWEALVFAMSTAALVIPMRGGLQQAPLNQSSGYFSRYPKLNQATVSPTWNLMQSTLEWAASDYSRFEFSSAENAARMVAAFRPKTDQSIPKGWVTVKKPNVILIIWEGGTAKAVASLGGKMGITPNLDSIASQGISFTRAYAAGDRSDKGMLAIMGGLPAQSGTSAIIYPSVTQKLPHLAIPFVKAGYSTHMYYGGELEFFNFKTLFLNTGFQHLTGKESFPETDFNAKWGAHDHVVFNRMLSDLDGVKQPWMSALFTLSSHEPFDVPGHNYKVSESEQTRFLTSMHYADSCLGDFIRKAKQKPWWDSTLVMILADHGHRLPGKSAAFAPRKFRIPLVLTGGALKAKPERIDDVVSQIDCGPMLLALASLLPDKPYPYARNPLSPRYRPNAAYVYQEGVGVVTTNDIVVFDNPAKQILRHPKNPKLTDTARAWLQEGMSWMKR